MVSANSNDASSSRPSGPLGHVLNLEISTTDEKGTSPVKKSGFWTNQEIRSKTFDGLLAAAVFLLGTIVIEELIPPIIGIFQTQGLLVYSLILLAISIICLERSIHKNYEEATKVVFGIAGGILGWAFVEISTLIGQSKPDSQTGMMLFILATLIVATMWKMFTSGVHLYFVVLFMGWIGHVVISGLQTMAAILPIFATLHTLLGWLSLVVGIGTFIWLFASSKSRISRFIAAVIIWYSAIIMIYVFRGGIM